MSINLFIKHKAYTALEEYVRQNEPLMYSSIDEVCDQKFITFVQRLRDEAPINMKDLVKYRNLQDIYYTDVIMSNITEKDRRIFYKEARVLSKCIRGHFHFNDSKVMQWYCIFIFTHLLDRREVRYKYDWVLCSPDNIIHIREKSIWIKNSTLLPYKIMKSLLRNYKQVSSVIPRVLVKLDDYAIEFVKNITGNNLSCLKYGVMDKSLFETIISEHVRINTSHSPNVLRWMSHYNVGIGMRTSPNVVLKYISTFNSSEIYQSPIYQSDLTNERNMILSTSSGSVK